MEEITRTNEAESAGITVVSKIDAAAVSALAKHVLYSQRRLYIMLYAVLAVLFSGIGSVLWVVLDDMLLGIAAIAAGLLVPPIVFWFMLRMVKSAAVKSPSAQSNAVQEFIFADKITVSERSDLSQAKNNVYEWAIVVSAFENDGYFFLFINAQSAFILIKSGFTAGTPANLRAELVKRLDTKFVCRAKI